MPKISTRVFIWILLSAVFFLLACETTALINGVLSAPPRRAALPIERAATQKPTRAPNAPFDFTVLGTPRCAVGDDSASIVNGRVVQSGVPLAGQKIQASSGPGGEPISEEPAVSDADGNFQVTFVCGGNACNGAFWVWLVNDEKEQVSPFVEFIFDQQCRRGSVNFSAR